MRPETMEVVASIVQQIQHEFDRSILRCRFSPKLANPEPALFWTDFSGPHKQTQRNQYAVYTATLAVQKNFRFQLNDLFYRVFSELVSRHFLFSVSVINNQLCIRLQFSLMHSWKTDDFHAHFLMSNLCKMEVSQQRTCASRKNSVQSFISAPKALNAEALKSPSEAGLSDVNIITPTTT